MLAHKQIDIVMHYIGKVQNKVKLNRKDHRAYQSVIKKHGESKVLSWMEDQGYLKRKGTAIEVQDES